MKRALILLMFSLSTLACSDNTAKDAQLAPTDTLATPDYPGNSDGHGNADSAHAAHKKDK